MDLTLGQEAQWTRKEEVVDLNPALSLPALRLPLGFLSDLAAHETDIVPDAARRGSGLSGVAHGWG